MIEEIVLLVDTQAYTKKKNTFVCWQTAYVCVMCIYIGIQYLLLKNWLYILDR